MTAGGAWPALLFRIPCKICTPSWSSSNTNHGTITGTSTYTCTRTRTHTCVVCTYTRTHKSMYTYKRTHICTCTLAHSVHTAFMCLHVLSVWCVRCKLLRCLTGGLLCFGLCWSWFMTVIVYCFRTRVVVLAPIMCWYSVTHCLSPLVPRSVRSTLSSPPIHRSIPLPTPFHLSPLPFFPSRVWKKLVTDPHSTGR